MNKFAAEVARHITEVRTALPDADLSNQEAKLRMLLDGAAEITKHLNKLHELHYASLEIEDQQERANMNAHEIIPVMDDLRAAVDNMEIIVERKFWPVPTYNEILFYA